MTTNPGSPDLSPQADHIAALPQRSQFANIFMGPNGIRAGWRLLIFVVIFMGLARLAGFTLHRIPAIHAWEEAQPKGTLTAPQAIFDEGVGSFLLFIAALIMSKIEKKSFADYGLPLTQAFGKRFWQGIPLGLAMLSILLGIIAALHGFSISGVALEGPAAARSGLLFGIVFILVGFFEEFSFRGYMQATLSSGIGFWPAAVLLSILFGAGHLGNQGEMVIGALMAGSFGLVAAFALQRTGSIWFPIGMHAAWDWGETYLYSVPDSGLVAQGHLLNSSFHGPTWLTGGTVGPEGSVLAFVVLLLWAVAIHFLFPARRSQF
jgi:uncharacterized protein